jgi:hypothetical protein
MLGIFIDSFLEIIKRPKLLVPALIGNISILAILIFFSLESYFEVVYDLAIVNNIPETGIVESIYYFTANHFQEIVVIIVSLFLNIIITLYLMYVYYGLINQKKSGLIKLMIEKIAKLPELAATTIFLFVLMTIFATVFIAITWVFPYIEPLSIAMPFILIFWVLFCAYFIIKLFFTPFFMCSQAEGLNKALRKCWKWSNKRIFKIIIFFTIMSAIYYIVRLIIDNMANLVATTENDTEIIQTLIVLIGTMFNNAYFNVGIVKFFLTEKE